MAPTQGAFDFHRNLPNRPTRPERLLFLLFPDEETSLRASRLAEQFVRDNALEGTLLRRERLHLSLQHVGDYRRVRTKFVYAAIAAAKSVSLGSFEVTFHSIGSFDGVPAAAGRPRRRPLVLLGGGGPVLRLHALLGAAMERNGLKAAASFTPHMTLFYGGPKMPMRPIEPIRFTAGAFCLVHSELGLSRYNLIDRWPLQG